MSSHLLVFTDPQIFLMTYEGFLVSGPATNPKEHEWASDILTKLESISEELPDASPVPGFTEKE